MRMRGGGLGVAVRVVHLSGSLVSLCPPLPQGPLLCHLPLPPFVYVRPRLQPFEVIPGDLSLPNPGADASPSLLWCRTPAFQDPFLTDGNEGFSSPFSLGLTCCRRGVLLAIGG